VTVRACGYCHCGAGTIIISNEGDKQGSRMARANGERTIAAVGGLAATGEQFVTEADWIPGFWNYLLDLDRDDLIAELVQNDLDQDATRTIISFERDRLICEGNGRPVEDDGWKRLRVIQGAGDSVPAKRGKIGVKNHGLKTAFTIGDEIRLMSAGRGITQTLYKHGRRKQPYPGASADPLPDASAPPQGCRIIVFYRDQPLEPAHGEANTLPAISANDIDALFLSACASTPEQFAGIVSPEVATHYQIILRHWRLGEARFDFSCTRPRRITKRVELFRRACAVDGTIASLPEALQEQAARRLIPLRGRLRERIADFYRRENRLFVEVSWRVDRRGKPKTGTGRFRYPIGYPPDSHQARTGHGAYFNAPFASDNKRHGPARNEATNTDLREACEALLVDVLAVYAIPRWGPDGLNPLVPSPGAENQDEAVRPLLASLASQGAMPTLTWVDAATALTRATQRFRQVFRMPPIRRGAKGHRYKFIIPSPTWSQEFDRALSILSPRSERQLHPLVPPAILELLADYNTDGFKELFVTFDENDAFERLTEGGNAFFDPILAPEKYLSHPMIAGAYLDLIHAAIAKDSCDEATQDRLQDALFLPDLTEQTVPFLELHSSAVLPSNVPGLQFPSILHPALAGHPIFKRRSWHRPRYTMVRFLDSGTLDAASETTRRLFWAWLRRNEGHISRAARPRLATIPIWPDEAGGLCVLSDLCEPRSRSVATILRDFVRLPHAQVRQSKLITSGGKGRTALRRSPSAQEVKDWLDHWSSQFGVEEAPASRTISALTKFEADVAALLQDTAIARVLKHEHVRLFALAQDRSIRERATLVATSRPIQRLALPPRFLLKSNQRAAALDAVAPALRVPSPEMVLLAFDEDGSNFAALQARLHQLVSLTDPGDDYRERLADLPIIPLHGKPHRPSMLAFTSNKGDYWGSWKTRLPAKGLSQDDQRRYRGAGVTSAMPDAETSRDFFRWLSQQDQVVCEHHIPCILRHILHRDGPLSWATIFTDIPIVPVRSRDGVGLVSLRNAHRRPVYLADEPSVAEAIIAHDPAVQLTIDRVKEVTEPITEALRRLGIKSLREALKEPETVCGRGDISPCDAEIAQRLEALRSNHFRRTFLKRLATLGVEQDLVWRDWHDRLSRIGEVRFADRVEASYRFRNRLYVIEADAGFDDTSGVFWMKRTRDLPISSLYEAIAAQLVFKPSARPVHYLALERALELEIRDPSYGRPTATDDEESAEDPEADSMDEPGGEGVNGDDPGEAVFGHSPFEPDASRNMPQPEPLSSKPSTQSRKQEPGGAPSTTSANSEKREVPGLEQEHIEGLKRRHYASHCQMCLSERAPQQLAPTNSYIQWEEVRRRVIEAHHVDLVSAGGARHAGNLILLCKLHHDNFGRRLTRTAITEALNSDAEPTVIRFGIGEEITEIDGRLISIVIPDTGELVGIFFTKEHAGYWLSQANQLVDALGGQP
jgi:hypothetical protein